MRLLRKTVSGIMLIPLLVGVLTFAFDISLVGANEFMAITATNVGGPITSNTTWTKANSPYIVTSNLLVSEGVTLTIESGVVVKFELDKLMQIDGELIAKGTDLEPIVFTSNKISPAPGDWSSIKFTDKNVDAQYDENGSYLSGSIMQYCILEYCCGLDITHSSPFIDHSVIRYTEGKGIVVSRGSPKITNNTIVGLKTYNGGGICIEGGTVIVSGNNISHNAERYLGLPPIISGGGIIVDSRFCSSIVTIFGNIICDNAAAYGGGISIHGNYPTTVTISGNVISDNYAQYDGAAIHCAGAAPPTVITIVGNVIKNNEGKNVVSAWAGEGGLTICLNDIVDNKGNGIGCYCSGIINYNNIYNNTPYNIRNFHYNMDATNNWWGTTNETAIMKHIYDWSDDSSLGVVIFKPYLTSLVTDFTLPTTPSVVDDGDYTINTSQLHATWSSIDPESGIAMYQYAIGTSLGGTDIVNWTSAGTNIEVTHGGLSLSRGTTYYVAVKARNGQGIWSEIGTSDGITVLGEDPFNWPGECILDESKLRSEERRALPFVIKWATIYSISPALLMAVTRQESNFNLKAVGDVESTYPAYGYLQVNWPAAKDAGYKGTPEQWKIEGQNPDKNIKYGAKYLKERFRKFQPCYATDLENALSAYNKGYPSRDNEKYVKQVIEGRDLIDGKRRGYLFFLTIYTQSPEICWMAAELGSPAELRVYDSQGRITGLLNGVEKIEIPHSTYYENIVVILAPADSYKYDVAGTSEGSYSLMIINGTAQEIATFNATDVPTSANAIHRYTIDWAALTRGEKGVSIQIDSNGDGAFEKTFTSDNELTRDEFMLQVFPVEAFPMWIAGVAVAAIATVTIAIAVFWRKRKQPSIKKIS
jgi:hypothetical protein